MALTRDQIQQIQKLRRQGKSYVEIGAIFNISASTAYRHASHITIMCEPKKPPEYKPPINSDWEPIKPPTLAQLMARR